MDTKKFHVLSFKFAFEGLVAALREEPNLKFHFLAGLLVIITAFLLKVSRGDWIILIFLIGFVICVELTNTAVEAVVDHVIQTNHPGAKLAKEISAAAVLVSAVTSVVIGLWIIFPYFT